MKFAIIRAEEARHAVRTLCRVLDVAPSSYYAWCKRPPSRRAVEDETLTTQITSVFNEHRGRYGSPRITRELRASGVRVGRHRVRRLMRGAALRVRRARRWVRTTDSSHDGAIAPNRLNRRFTIEAPNRAWVSDITYLPTRQGWLYLAVVIDLFSRAVVGWSMSRRIDQQLALDALDAAVEGRRPAPGLIVHSDRGTQYGADAYQRRLSDHALLGSMSRKGNCWDNAVAESFFGTLKAELLGDTIFSDALTAQSQVFEYIEVYYNRRRRHSTLDYVSPLGYERSRNAA